MVEQYADRSKQELNGSGGGGPIHSRSVLTICEQLFASVEACFQFHNDLDLAESSGLQRQPELKA